MRWQPDSRMRFSGLFMLLAGIVLFSLFSCATAPITEERGGGVAVWDLDDLSPGPAGADLGELLSVKVMEVLRGKGQSVVERTRLLRALEELRLGSSSLADDSTRLRLGKLIGAKRMIFGGYLVVGDHMRIDLRLVDVETGKVLKAVQKTASSSNLSAWLNAAEMAAGEL